MTGRYPWIPTKPRVREPRSGRPVGRPFTVCGRCGWEWVGRRKTCPACLTRPDEGEGR